MERAAERESGWAFELLGVFLVDELPALLRAMSGQARSSVVVIRDSTPHDHRKSCLPPRQPPATNSRSCPSSWSPSTRTHRLNDAALPQYRTRIPPECSSGSRGWTRHRP